METYILIDILIDQQKGNQRHDDHTNTGVWT